ESRRRVDDAVAARQEIVDARAERTELRVLVAAVAQSALAAHAQLMIQQLAVVVVDGRDASAPILRRITRLLRQIRETAIHLPVRVTHARARQVSRIIELQIIAEVHADPLLPPTVVHLVVGPDRRAGIARALPLLLDVAADQPRAYVPARRRAPVV